MRVIKIKPEYGCFPIWLYDEDGLFIDNRLPHKNVQNRHAVKAAFVKVQEAYEKLFVNNDSEFSYIGFSSEEQKAQFTEQFNSAAELLSKAVGDKYIIVNAVDLKNMQKE